MNPQYNFYLNGRQAYPIWSNKLGKVIAKQDGEQFFRERLNGSLVFSGEDYTYINTKVFDYIFTLVIEYSSDGGATFVPYWAGTFKKEDCKFNADDMTVEVTPEVSDLYTKVLENLDREFDLVKLAPEMSSIRATRRPALQLYIPNQSTIFTFVSGMYWEAECTPCDNAENELTLQYHFAQITDKLIATTEIGGNMILFEGNVPATIDSPYVLIANNGYRLGYSPSGGGSDESWVIFDENNNILYQASIQVEEDMGYPREVTLSPSSGSGANITVSVRNVSIFSRLLVDTEVFPNTGELGFNDLGGYNRNYHFACPYSFNASHIGYSTDLSTTPTKYGLYQSGQYYEPPTFVGGGEVYPVTPAVWGRLSVWVDASEIYNSRDEQGRKIFNIRNAYSLGAALKAVLGAIDSNLTFSETVNGSQFFYGNTPIENNQDKGFYLVPKSNVLNANYDQSAQKAPVTLRQLLNMVRDAFRCYWYLEQSGNTVFLRIEHIYYFMHGGSYTGTPNIDIDLTAVQTVRNNKRWAFGLNKFNYEKSAIPGRYAFRWMDEVTEAFKGFDIEMLNGVTLQPREGRIEQIQIEQFSTDIDYLMLNPSDSSKDGFCLLKAEPQDLVDYDSPIIQNFIPGQLIYKELISYEAMPNERVFMKIAINPTEIGGNFYAQLWAADEENRPLAPLTSRINSYIDPSVGGFYVLPNGTKKILAFCNGGSVGLYGFESDNYLTVSFYDYYPYGNLDARHYLLQNGELAFGYLQRYYIYDLPSSSYKINGCGWLQMQNGWELVQGTGIAQGVKKTKKQEVSFPALSDPDTKKLIKTDLGSGEIENITLNLSSRNAKTTLVYEP